MTYEIKFAPGVVSFGGGDVQVRCVHGIEFTHITDSTKPGVVKQIHRIGAAKVPDWLYELVLGMATELQTGRPRTEAPKCVVTRGADGSISVAGKS